MNFLFFTPVSIASAIARMSSLVVRELLAGGHQVTVVSTESTAPAGDHESAFSTRVLGWRDLVDNPSMAGDVDHYVYQVGDSYICHEGALYWLQRQPGVVCLHDLFLGHLFNAWAVNHYDQARLVLKAWYGQNAVDAYRPLESGAPLIETGCDEWSMIEWVCSMALGVICHSEGGADRVMHACPGPIRVVHPVADVTSELPSLPESAAAEVRNYAMELIEVAGLARRAKPALDAIFHLSGINARWADGNELFLDDDALGRLEIFSSGG